MEEEENEVIEEDNSQPEGIYSLDVDCVRRKEAELLEKYPD